MKIENKKELWEIKTIIAELIITVGELEDTGEKISQIIEQKL